MRDEKDVYDANGVYADVLLSLYGAERSNAAVSLCADKRHVRDSFMNDEAVFFVP